jgi:DNA-binding CsgD family transcriptional regulator
MASSGHDAIRLDVVYVQAKRYSPNHKIGWPDLQGLRRRLGRSESRSRHLHHYEQFYERRPRLYAIEYGARFSAVTGVRMRPADRSSRGDPLLMTAQNPPRVPMPHSSSTSTSATRCMPAPADFLLKDVRREQLADAVRAVAAGDTLLAPAITRRLVEQYLCRPRPGDRTPPGLATLTDRELDVLRLVAPGRSHQQIASTLFLGESTVKTHLTHLFDKPGVHDRATRPSSSLRVGPDPAR